MTFPTGSAPAPGMTTTRGLPTAGFNKPIQNLWMSVTDACNMRCDYCFVPHAARFMSRETARAAIDFALGAPSDVKRIDYYGGEPLMNADLLAFSMPYALEQGARLGKRVRTYISTNATLYKPSMTFLETCDVHVLVSIDGDAATHDARRHKYRRGAPNGHGGGTHAEVARRVGWMHETLKPHNLCALWTVDPDAVEHMDGNHEALLSLGFRCVNIEPVRTRRWTPPLIARFLAGVRNALARIEATIDGPPDRWLFINSLNHELVQCRGIQDRAIHCPFYVNFIVYPSGRCTITPTIVFETLQDHFAVGDTVNGLMPFYESCVHDPDSDRCKRCVARGEAAERHSDRGAEQVRSQLYRAFADRLYARAAHDPVARAYVLESEKWCYV